MNKKFYMFVFFIFLMSAYTSVFAWEKTIPNIDYYPTPAANPDWSGPATAKMILTADIIEADPSYVVKTQAELWTYISAHNDTAWNTLGYPPVHTDPIAMEACLKEYDTRSGWTYVTFHTATYDASVSQKIVYTIAKYDVPPAVPLSGGLNWVAVFAVNTTSDPLAPGPYSINWFQINDPSDPILGMGKYIFYNDGSHSILWENGPSSAFSHILTPTPFPNDYQKMAICDPDTPGPLKVQAPQPQPRRETVLLPYEAKEAAIKGLKKYNIINKPGYQHAEKSIRSGNPILVRRMVNRMPADYYIVPMVKRYFIFWKKLIGAVIIDAYTGSIIEASIAKKPVCYPYLSRSLAKAKKILIKKIKKKEGFRYSDVKAETPILTWEPGLSVSPFFPLWKVQATIKGANQMRYLDFNGNVHLPVNYPPVKKKQKQVK